MRIFKVEKTLSASAPVVFAMFSEAKFLEQWIFPPSVRILRSDLHFVDGGRYLFGMLAPDKAPVWGRFDFESVVPPRSLTFVQSVTDEDGRIISPLQKSDWLLRMRSEISLESHGVGTRLRQEISVIDAGAAEQGFVEFTWKLLRVEYEAALERLALIFQSTPN